MKFPSIFSPRNGLRRIAILLGVVAVLAVRTGLSRPAFFVDGQTAWRIYIAEQADPIVMYGVQELTNALKKISGVDFPVQAGGEVPPQNAVILGDLTNPQIRQQAVVLKLTPGEIEQTAVKTLNGALYLAGNQPRGALYAVYSFLNRELGVRWLWPGESGEFMPVRTEWLLPEINYAHMPGYTFRGFHLCGDWRDHQIFRTWMGRNFINIHRHSASVLEKRLGFYAMYSSHNANLSGTDYFAEHPEYFAEIDGKRYPSNICMSNPEVLKLVAEKNRAHILKNPQLDILSLFPSDNQDYCRCAECARMDVSTAWFTFYNQLTDILKAEFPHLKFATIAYQGYRHVPACQVRNTAFVEYATYGRCNVHPFSDTTCTRNAEELKMFDGWEATGVPIGHYGYEFDIFTRNARFTPFLTMIDDAIKEGHRRKQIALITEVGLSPRTGPITSVHAVQNRMPLYLYAQLLWNPDQSMETLLAEWCRTAYGDASEAMLNYFLSLNRAWTTMERHAGILGDAMSVVDAFITEPLQASVSNDFAEAERMLAKQTPSPVRERAVEAFERERVLYKQWQDLADMKSGSVPLVNAPLLAQATNFTDAVCRPLLFPVAEDTVRSEVRVAWTQEALLLRWRCGEPQIDQLQAHATQRDQGVMDDDAIEVEIASGITGERYFLGVSSQGVQSDIRYSTVGVMEPQWDPEWQSQARVGAQQWEVDMTIPFAALGGAPAPEESWQIRLRRTAGGRKGRMERFFPEKMPATIFFNGSSATGRQLLYWSGAPSREQAGDAVCKQGFMLAGWDAHIVSTGAMLRATHPIADAFWFRHPDGQIKVPAEYWSAQLAPAVSNGALAVFISYWGIPLERYFNDPSFKLSLITISPGLPLPGRKTTYIASGEWGLEPYDVSASLKRGYSPCYGFIPADTNAWTILAIGNNGDGHAPFPYLLARRYGRGLVVVGGDAIPASAPQLLENLLRWNEK